MATKQSPDTGKVYDEETHQWIDAPAPASAPVIPAVPNNAKE
jgi:hypothetical protein